MATFKDWMRKHFDRDDLRNMVEYGINQGFPGLIYPNETMRLYRRFKTEIWDILNQDAQYFGISVHALIHQLGVDESDHKDVYKNALVWYAAQHVANGMVGYR